jgi:hypothetical protein
MKGKRFQLRNGVTIWIAFSFIDDEQFGRLFKTIETTTALKARIDQTLYFA